MARDVRGPKGELRDIMWLSGYGAKLPSEYLCSQVCEVLNFNLRRFLFQWVEVNEGTLCCLKC